MAVNVGINMKLVEDEVFTNVLVVTTLRSVTDKFEVCKWYKVEGQRSQKLNDRLSDLFKTTTPEQIYLKCLINNCKVQMGGLEFYMEL